MKVLGAMEAVVLFAALSFPLSAGAFGRSPSSSEVFPTGTIHIKSNTDMTDSNGEPRIPHAVPEPSSLMFLAIAIGLGAVVWLKKRVDQGFEK